MGRELGRVIQNVGIIGAGSISPAHVKAIQRLPRVRITGVLDTDATAAKKLCTQFGIHSYFNEPDHFYHEANPDIVHILTPPHSHEQLTIDALNRGIHVLVEKPLSLTVTGCEAIRVKAESKGLTVGVSENLTFCPIVQAAVAAIKRGDVGRPIHITTFYGFNASHLQADLSDWLWVNELSGGVLEDLIPHPLTVTRALAGQELELVHQQIFRSGRLAFSLDDELRLHFAGEHGLTADVTVTLSAHPADFTVIVYGTQATLRLDVVNPVIQKSRLGAGPQALAKGVSAVGSAIGVLTQTASNAVAFGLLRSPKPANPVHVLRAHYEALQQQGVPPGSIQRGTWVVRIVRQIWPRP
jgi:2-alkyl-3-oxoalkanoate reductase